MTNDSKYNRGSEWRKWDLHVHTPESDGFGGTWNQFKIQLKKADCAVIGINDYFSVSGYKKLKEEISAGILDIENKVILPIVEMRMSDSLQNRNTNNRRATHFNFHIIFSDEINVDDIENFIKALECEDTRIGTDYDNKEKLKGKKVSFKETLKTLKNDKKFKDKFLVWLPYDEYGGIDEINPESDSSIKKGFIKKSDIIGSSNEKQIDFFHWKSKLKNDGSVKFTQEQFKKWFKRKKPCIKGSDSHSQNYPIGKLKDKNSDPIDKFCWIKANPSFEGLKQITYEPTDRVKIQELEPEEKEHYQVIDNVKFLDNSFTPNKILINQNLTTIIGGKSTGKSILLRNIAQTIDPNEVSERLQEVNLTEYSEQVSEFIVEWKDKQKNEKNESSGINKKIIYIPQSYLNRLVDKKEDKTSIDDIIKNVLEQEDDVKAVFSELESLNRGVEKIITQDIEDLFYKKNDIQDLYKNIKKIGDKKGIQSEIKKLKKEIANLKKKAGMSTEQISKYNELLGYITQTKNLQEITISDLELLNNLRSLNLSIVPDESIYSLSSKLQKVLGISLKKVKNTANKQWLDKIEIELKKTKKDQVTTQIKLNKLSREFKPLLEKAKKSKSLREKIKKTEEEEIKLIKISKQEEMLKTLKSDYLKLIKTISNNHSKFFSNIFNARVKILKQRSITKDQDLELRIDIIFENKAFQNNFVNDISDQRKLPQFESGLLQDYQYSSSVYQNDVEKIIRGVLNKKLTLKSSYSRKEAITKLVQNWFSFDYKIKQDGDEIAEMSPGKKSFVLLKLLIELDNSKCPILLDQPEDDLDNRSIYNDLVKFIKTKKKERQIIIATHNPNLVVGADSECVIVANQDGDKSKNITYDFEYVQGSLENTFSIEKEKNILYKQGIQEHVCDVLEGGKKAFEQRKNKYNL